LCLTAVTGIVDAVSFLALGHVFTANMTGNIVFLGFALAGTSGLSVSRSLLALFCFGLGALMGGRISAIHAPRGIALEAVLLGVAALAALPLITPYDQNPAAIYAVIVTSAIAMGIRNAVVRKLGVPDLTTTVLTLTITGLAADSSLAGGENPRWQRRCAAILAMVGGAAVGALLLKVSVALTLAICAAVSGACALTAFRFPPSPKQTST
jgi:uncharacterized membrane protein YoaK (UPF0700 family)